MELEALKWHVFHAYIIHCHGPKGFVMRDAIEILLLQKPRNHGKEMSFKYIHPYVITIKKNEKKKGRR